MDLTFGNTKDYLFAPRVEHLLDPDMDIVQTGKPAAIRLSVDAFQVGQMKDDLKERVRAAFSACVRLVRFDRKPSELLKTLASESRRVAKRSQC